MKQLQDCINQNYDQIIDQISKIKDKTIKDIKQKFIYCGLNQSQRQLFQLIQQKQKLSITGKILYKTHLNSAPIFQIQQFLSQSIKQITKNYQKINQQIFKLASSINQQIQSFRKITQSCTLIKQSRLKTFQNFSSPSKSANSSLSVLKSKVITQLAEYQYLEKLFFPKIIQSYQLLYRASENQFQVKKFREKCHDIPNTLILCQTQFNKKIGAYTPLTWSLNPGGNFKIDELYESFIFSLTYKDKFHLECKEDAICDDQNYGPQFGRGYDLSISNKAKQKAESSVFLSNSYNNYKYKNDGPDSYLRFVGHPENHSYFKLKQWEVWGLIFQ